VSGWVAALLLLAASNAVPWVVGRLLGERLAAPLDFGIRLSDGERLLGSHKTWRGLASGMIACELTASLCGYPPGLGVRFAALSLAGDACTSAIKRRLRLAPGTGLPLMDQLVEALLPLMLLRDALGLGAWEIAIAATLFTLIDIAATDRLRRRS
jgi:CDP-2,3-bis-(O-geranylgeranyl)-sn-glycerol synthase